MNELMIFDYNNKKVRTIEKDGEFWWVLKDICEVLELSNSRIVADRLDDDERCKFNLPRQGETWVINESGLYNVILRSDKAEAKPFKKWVTGEVLPSIRKNGGYIANQEKLTSEQILANAVLVAQNIISQKDKEISDMKPKAIFADAVATAKTSILIGELAKMIRQNGIDMGEKRLFEWLRENGYLVKRRGTDYNAPTQRSMELGLFEVKETAITHSDGHVTISKTTKVTGKGQQYFINKFLCVPV